MTFCKVYLLNDDDNMLSHARGRTKTIIVETLTNNVWSDKLRAPHMKRYVSHHYSSSLLIVILTKLPIAKGDKLTKREPNKRLRQTCG
jgi:hypothetical protein